MLYLSIGYVMHLNLDEMTEVFKIPTTGNFGGGYLRNARNYP